jgi:hypothetical protein
VVTRQVNTVWVMDSRPFPFHQAERYQSCSLAPLLPFPVGAHARTLQRHRRHVRTTRTSVHVPVTRGVPPHAGCARSRAAVQS